jgi:mTERF domain-containing protein
MLRLRLRCCVIDRILSPPSASPVAYLRRLLSVAAPAAAASPGPGFAAEKYLVDTCGLTRAQAFKASARLSHLKSPANPDAVRAFLAGLGLSTADVAALVAKDPKFLCAGVEKTLAPVADGLTGLGLSSSEVARLVPLAGDSFRCRSILPSMHYYLSLLGSYENVLRVLKGNSYLFKSSLDRVVQPNVAFLREYCGLGACDIVKLCISTPRMILTDLDRLKAMVACAEGLGVPRGSGMFRQTLHAVSFLTEERIAVKVEQLKKTFRWSDDDVSIAVSKSPILLKKSKESLQRASEFLISEVGLEPAYIAHRAVLINYRLEGRLRPRYYVLKFLKENGLLDHNRDYYSAVVITEKVFMEKYIHPYKETVPRFAEDYADACRGQVPARFRFA